MKVYPETQLPTYTTTRVANMIPFLAVIIVVVIIFCI